MSETPTIIPFKTPPRPPRIVEVELTFQAVISFAEDFQQSEGFECFLRVVENPSVLNLDRKAQVVCRKIEKLISAALAPLRLKNLPPPIHAEDRPGSREPKPSRVGRED